MVRSNLPAAGRQRTGAPTAVAGIDRCWFHASASAPRICSCSGLLRQAIRCECHSLSAVIPAERSLAGGWTVKRIPDGGDGPQYPAKSRLNPPAATVENLRTDTIPNSPPIRIDRVTVPDMSADLIVGCRIRGSRSLQQTEVRVVDYDAFRPTGPWTVVQKTLTSNQLSPRQGQ